MNRVKKRVKRLIGWTTRRLMVPNSYIGDVKKLIGQTTGTFTTRKISLMGFSLVEMMIVLVIVSLFLVFGARRLKNKSTEMKSSVRHFSALIKKIRNKARVQNKTFRLVFDLPEKNSKKEQSYWIESTEKQALLMTGEELEELSEELEEIEIEEGKKEKPDPQGFVMNQQIIKKPPAFLSGGLFFEFIEIDGNPIEKVETGRVYIYFFPQGYIQRSTIHLSNRDKLHWTLAVHGITGRVDIYTKNLSLEDLRKREE